MQIIIVRKKTRYEFIVVYFFSVMIQGQDTRMLPEKKEKKNIVNLTCVSTLYSLPSLYMYLLCTFDVYHSLYNNYSTTRT